eukprot:5061917-Amphidinium_carterae.1
MRLANTYGVTECCVYNTLNWVSGCSLHTKQQGSIGLPLLRNTLYVSRLVGGSADESTFSYEEASEEGEEGELLVGGAQVGEGYAQLPELTQKRFIQHAHIGRAYVTGDIVKVTDGMIKLLGRRDNQVKVRGHRLELSEVERWVQEATKDLVKAVTVVYVKGRLVACCVPYDWQSSGRAQSVLRGLLQWLCAEHSVPAAMRPQGFYFVVDLPQTTSGKVSRKDLEADLHVEQDGLDELLDLTSRP